MPRRRIARSTSLYRRRILTAALALPAPARAQAAARSPAPLAPRPLPARLLPVPETVSPALQQRIGAPFPPGWDTVPTDAAGWKALQAESAATVAPELPAPIQAQGVKCATPLARRRVPF